MTLQQIRNESNKLQLSFVNEANSRYDVSIDVHWSSLELKTMFHNLVYFDKGADHPDAWKPKITRRMRAHIRHMKAKRSYAARAGM